MSLTCQGLCGIVSDPICPGKSLQDGAFYSLQIATADPHKIVEGKPKIHKYTLEIWVPRNENKEFLAKCKRKEIYQLRLGTIQDRGNGTTALVTSTSNFIHLERPLWASGKEQADES